MNEENIKYFFKEGYELIYPDINERNLDALEHYILFGQHEGRCNGNNPPLNIFFKEGYEYIYPDVIEKKIDSWKHYVLYGRHEGRCNGLVPPKHMFFKEGYELIYPDITERNIDAWQHFVLHGRKEGRSNGLVPPKNMFFKEGYEFIYKDIRNKNIDPWEHYVLFGRLEGRSNGRNYPKGLFVEENYRLFYKDISQSKINAWEHFVIHGSKEGRIFDNVIQRKKVQSTNKKTVLLIGHELSVTGAPLSLKGIAKILLNSNFNVEIWVFPTIYEKKLYDDLDCNVYVVPREASKFKKLSELVVNYDFIICNTVVTAHYVRFLNKCTNKYLWIIREGESFNRLLDVIGESLDIFNDSNKNTVVVSEYTQGLIFEKTGIKLKVLNNFIEDDFLHVKNVCSKIKEDNAIHFTICGTIEKRKGFDLCISAFLRISVLRNKDFVLHIVGDLSKRNQLFWLPLVEATKNYKNIIWHGKLVGDEKWNVFFNTDVFLVPSLDEASSRIVLEAAMLNKTFIVSENVGAKYLARNNAGIICKVNDVLDLNKKVMHCLNIPKIDLIEMGNRARINYLKTSTEDIYKNKLLSLINVSTNTNSNKIVANNFLKFSEEYFQNFNCIKLSEHSLYFKDVNYNTLFNNKYFPSSNENEEMVNVFVPVYNGLDHLKKLLPTLFKNTDSPHYFVFIDDHSNEETKNWLIENTKFRDDCCLIFNENNLGFPSSINKALATIDERNFVILNSDTQVPKGWLRRLVRPLAHKNVATVTPLSSCASIYSFPIPNNDELNKHFLSNIGLDKIDNVFKNLNEDFIEVPVGHGFCMAFNINAWKEIGPFNSLLYEIGYGEEVDWCQRAIDSGYKNVLTPNLFVAHWHGGSFSSEIKKKRLESSSNIIKLLYPNYANNIQYYLKKFPLREIYSFVLLVIAQNHQQFDFEKFSSKSNCVSISINCYEVIYIIEDLLNSDLDILKQKLAFLK